MIMRSDPVQETLTAFYRSPYPMTEESPFRELFLLRQQQVFQKLLGFSHIYEDRLLRQPGAGSSVTADTPEVKGNKASLERFCREFGYLNNAELLDPLFLYHIDRAEEFLREGAFAAQAEVLAVDSCRGIAQWFDWFRDATDLAPSAPSPLSRGMASVAPGAIVLPGARIPVLPLKSLAAPDSSWGDIPEYGSELATQLDAAYTRISSVSAPLAREIARWVRLLVPFSEESDTAVDSGPFGLGKRNLPGAVFFQVANQASDPEESDISLEDCLIAGMAQAIIDTMERIPIAARVSQDSPEMNPHREDREAMYAASLARWFYQAQATSDDPTVARMASRKRAWWDKQWETAADAVERIPMLSPEQRLWLDCLKASTPFSAAELRGAS